MARSPPRRLRHALTPRSRPFRPIRPQSLLPERLPRRRVRPDGRRSRLAGSPPPPRRHPGWRRNRPCRARRSSPAHLAYRSRAGSTRSPFCLGVRAPPPPSRPWSGPPWRLDPRSRSDDPLPRPCRSPRRPSARFAPPRRGREPPRADPAARASARRCRDGPSTRRRVRARSSRVDSSSFDRLGRGPSPQGRLVAGFRRVAVAVDRVFRSMSGP